ncbi:unnamed protein product, partial [Owenia fusiformis]
DSDTSSSCSSNHSKDSKKVKSKSKKKKKKSKSGINQTRSNSCQNPQKYPHIGLKYEFSRMKIKYNDLDINLFTAGALNLLVKEIENHSISKRELLVQLKHIIELMYINKRGYPWHQVRNFHANILSEIEAGEMTWGDDTTHIFSHLSVNKKQVSNNTSVHTGQRISWYCVEYNRDNCNESSAHMSKLPIKGQTRLLEHICSNCYVRDKTKSNHSKLKCTHPNVSYTNYPSK